MKIILILSILSSFFLLLLNLRLKGEVAYKKSEQDELLVFKLKFGQLELYQNKIPSISQRTDLIERPIKYLQKFGLIEEKLLIGSSNPVLFLRFFVEKFPLLFRKEKKLFQKIELTKWTWITKFGGKNHAKTGLTVGFLWYLKHFIYRKLILYTGYQKDNFLHPNFNVIPDFNQKIFSLEFHCIFIFKIGHIITTGLQFSRIVFSLLVRR